MTEDELGQIEEEIGDMPHGEGLPVDACLRLVAEVRRLQALQHHDAGALADGRKVVRVGEVYYVEAGGITILPQVVQLVAGPNVLPDGSPACPHGKRSIDCGWCDTGSDGAPR